MLQTIIFAALCGFGFHTSASTLIVEDFETPDFTVSTNIGTMISTSSGTTVTSGPSNFGILLQESDSFGYTGSQSILASESSDTLIFSFGQTVIPYSIDVDNVLSANANVSIAFTDVNSNVFTQNFSTDNIRGLEIFSFDQTDFSAGIVQAELASSGNFISADNLRFTPIPEPASIALLACTGAVLARRQRDI